MSTTLLIQDWYIEIIHELNPLIVSEKAASNRAVIYNPKDIDFRFAGESYLIGCVGL